MAIRPTKYLAMPDGNDYEFFGKSYYGVCSTESSSEIKEVTIEGFTYDALVAGVHISIKFTNANTFGNPKLRITGTGTTKEIRMVSNTIFGYNQVPSYLWAANQIIDFVYDGLNWLILNLPNRIWYGTCTSSDYTETKGCAINGFDQSCLQEGLIIAIYFAHENTATSNVALRINGSNNEVIRVISNNGSYDWGAGVHTFLLKRDVNNVFRWHMIDAPPVISVNGQTGKVTIAVPTASNVLPSMDGTASSGSNYDYSKADHVHPTDTSRQETLVSGTNIKTIGGESILGSGNISLPTVVSDLTNDAGYISTETDPTVPSWAKETNPPTYTLTYNQNSSVGSAQAGTAVTGTPNYTPSGDVVVTTKTVDIPTGTTVYDGVEGYILNIGVGLTITPTEIIDKVTFNGNGVHFTIERET